MGRLNLAFLEGSPLPTVFCPICGSTSSGCFRMPARFQSYPAEFEHVVPVECRAVADTIWTGYAARLRSAPR
jgi:hypothetical protein